MEAPRRSSQATRERILASARELFAKHGVDGVSVRDIAAAAGCNHALVHRYFGTKSEMVVAILENEGRVLSEMAAPVEDLSTSLAVAGDIFKYALTEARTSLLLMLRAEIDGLAPERLLDRSALQPLVRMVRWLEEQGAGKNVVDPRIVAMTLAAALMGLAALQPLLTAGVGLEEEDPEVVLQRCVDTLLGFAAGTLGARDDLDHATRSRGSIGQETGRPS